MNPHFSRPNWAQIDLDALRHNARALARHVAPARLIAVVKAGAYGHGALEIARVLQKMKEVQMLAVASVDEARLLREGGICAPILLFGALLPNETSEVVRLDLTPTVWTSEIACALETAMKNENRRLKIHFKVDTGMHRLGANWCQATRAFEEVSRFENLEIAAVYTHFACADEECADDFTALQLRRFNEFCASCELSESVLKHAANSAGALRFRAAHFDLVRPGIALYGANPCLDLAPDLELRPVMTWRARITALQNVAKGEGVSYGQTWTAPRDSQIAILPAGYADGYARSLSNCGEVQIGGKIARVVGRVTMDQILVDVTGLEAQIGDVATLWGEGFRVEDVAARAGTIAYELLCAVSPRVPRVYIGDSTKNEA
ncbi:alanine racemase [Abditibacterium utsteinense]|uniref:Alanine racemase n=1 Tax=Abditibacterium utsteinense TaxID=1960156 RepID=A0A2S8STA3_9BACT|nr:alanine racemase [Abditibacterium utsteinense]PQV64031.1 alanine racemase [Abditibacterium utsteinense]